MQIWLGVKDFARIEDAKIQLSDYVLFVGQNNCGKTFLMQLIQGVLEKLPDFFDENTFGILLDEETEAYSSYTISNKNISQLSDYITKRLHEEKENLVKEIFQREIPIGELYVDFRLEDDLAYNIGIWDKKKDIRDHVEKFLGPDESRYALDQNPNLGKLSILSELNTKNGTRKTRLISHLFAVTKYIDFLLHSLMGEIIESDSLFFPASRTGLLLLYREFFLNKTDHIVSFNVQKDEFIENNQDYGGLTKPVYEFLRFLQGYSEMDSANKRYEDVLQFFDDHLIEGHISADQHKAFLYRAKNDESAIPMHLASSMINEVAPIVMAVTGSYPYKRFIIDEIESSLHPEKQFELVRFLNRLNNKGKKLIISTHSDTFVSRMNNLYILSHNRDKIDIIQDKFGLTSEDLIDPQNLLVYEFILQDNGKSIVKKVRGDKRTGFQFDAFAGSAMKLYDEALKIGELQK